MAKHSTVEELRQRLIAAVVGANPAHTLGQIHVQGVARQAGISASTLTYHFSDLEGLRDATHVELVRRMCVRPNDNVLDALENSLRTRSCADQMMADFMRGAVKQLATDPSFSYLIGGARQLDKPDIVASCNDVFERIAFEFSRPLRIALASAGLDVSAWGDKAIVDLTLQGLIGGAMAHFLFGEGGRDLTLRGITFEVGGAMVATSLWLLLDIKDPTAASALDSIVF